MIPVSVRNLCDDFVLYWESNKTPKTPEEYFHDEVPKYYVLDNYYITNKLFNYLREELNQPLLATVDDEGESIKFTAGERILKRIQLDESSYLPKSARKRRLLTSRKGQFILLECLQWSNLVDNFSKLRRNLMEGNYPLVWHFFKLKRICVLDPIPRKNKVSYGVDTSLDFVEWYLKNFYVGYLTPYNATRLVPAASSYYDLDYFVRESKLPEREVGEEQAVYEAVVSRKFLPMLEYMTENKMNTERMCTSLSRVLREALQKITFDSNLVSVLSDEDFVYFVSNLLSWFSSEDLELVFSVRGNKEQVLRAVDQVSTLHYASNSDVRETLEILRRNSGKAYTSYKNKVVLYLARENRDRLLGEL